MQFCEPPLTCVLANHILPGGSGSGGGFGNGSVISSAVSWMAEVTTVASAAALSTTVAIDMVTAPMAARVKAVR